jgi:hypothetical protein
VAENDGATLIRDHTDAAEMIIAQVAGVAGQCGGAGVGVLDGELAEGVVDCGPRGIVP